jgi:hypothetical protein
MSLLSGAWHPWCQYVYRIETHHILQYHMVNGVVFGESAGLCLETGIK